MLTANVFKYGHGTVALLTRLFPESNSLFPHRTEVLPELIGAEKEKNSATGFVSNSLQLFCACGFRQQ